MSAISGEILRNWDSRAAVRSKPRRLLGAELAGDPFPREFAPALQHAHLRNAPSAAIRDILLQHLFSYLHFTDRLEHEAVNQTARRLATGASGCEIAPALRLDCYRVYCDEAYHSLFCADLMQQLVKRYSFHFNPGEGHPGLACFHRQIAGCAPEERAWFELFFVIVSETLISGVLSRLPQDRQVIEAVRLVVADHAADEAAHHRLFSKVCEAAWHQVPRVLRAKLAAALPGFILDFLAPDLPALRAILARHLDRKAANEVLEESYPEAELRRTAAAYARSTLRLFQRVGVFESAEAEDAFTGYGLVLQQAAGGHA